jgi:hypothetical protein
MRKEDGKTMVSNTASHQRITYILNTNHFK